MHSINPFYLDKKLAPALKKEFAKNKELPTLALGQFLQQKEFLNLKALNTIGWKETYIPDMHRYQIPTKVTPEEKELAKVISAFVKGITGKQPLKQSSMRFGHRDFTILHDKETQPVGVIAYLFLDDWNPDWGGQVVFMRKGETLASFTPKANTLLVVERKKGVQSFIKYVNAQAGKRVLTMFG